MRPAKRGREALVRWRGFDHAGDTWEPEEHVKPLTKIVKFLEQPPAHVDMMLPQWLFLDALARQLTSKRIQDRGPLYKHELAVDGLVLPEVALRLLDILRRKVEPPLKLERSADGRRTTLYVDQLEHISKVVALHISRPTAGAGALRIRCGSTSHEDMLMVIPPLEIEYISPINVQSLPALGGRKFLVRLTTVAFNGKTGSPVWPKILHAADRYSLAEQRNIVAHAKAELAQRWSPAPVSHGLLAKGWHKLPPEVFALRFAHAMPSSF